MVRNFLKIAVRHLLNNKGFSFINIAGLAIGMASQEPLRTRAPDPDLRRQQQFPWAERHADQTER
ncbi:hypothetical protein [Chitinophaga rhizosphaerae]|uniref:hypothetical protein n=1 Tax=Chitinophaga rhizosphaerae TaxID=1864947 RepID=UPI000F7FDE90|nr:hypothetical protein [Chitinophaga rhizosphaerae]